LSFSIAHSQIENSGTAMTFNRATVVTARREGASDAGIPRERFLAGHRGEYPDSACDGFQDGERRALQFSGEVFDGGKACFRSPNRWMKAV
jgi:hypothetical protein